MQKKSIIIAGAVAQKPLHGGHTWVFLQYLLGFKRLGWDVLLVDRLGPEHLRDADGQPCAPADCVGYKFLSACMASFGLNNCFSILLDGKTTLGLVRDELLACVRESTLLLNVMGFLRDEEILAAAGRRVFLDIDPGFPQMWKANGLHDSFAGHDAFVSVGRDVGKESCLVPDCGLSWITIAPPVVLEHWPVRARYDGPITSVATWRGAYGPVTYGDKTFGLRVHEFRKFVGLPKAIRGQHPPVQLALDIHPADVRDSDAIREAGWELIDPRSVSSSPDSYQRYIAGSSAEFCVAKNMYVQAKTAWFSDRSACYLASGKPVIAQETGWSKYYSAGTGLMTYSTLDEAAAAVEGVFSNPEKHSRAAREIAQEYFDSDKVLGQLLDALVFA